MPAASMLVIAAQTEATQRLAHFAVGDAGGGDADPRVGRVDRHPVQLVRRRVAPGALEPRRADVAFDLHVVRREQPRIGSVDRAERRRCACRGRRSGAGRVRCRPCPTRRRRRRRSSSTSTARSGDSWRWRGGRGRAPPGHRRDRRPADGGPSARGPSSTERSSSSPPGSSPTMTRAPPWCDAPAYTPWRIASPARSSPGALPYQIPRTPS